jgi:hypothetical protein
MGTSSSFSWRRRAVTSAWLMLESAAGVSPEDSVERPTIMRHVRVRMTERSATIGHAPVVRCTQQVSIQR